MRKVLLLISLVALSACGQQTYMDSEKQKCISQGGEPSQIYAVFANGLVMGCHYKDEE